jgi:hypothetical protein
VPRLGANPFINYLNSGTSRYIVKAMKFVQLKSLKDLVLLVASSPTMNVIQHLQNGDFHLYFIIGGTLSEIFLYFVKETKSIDGNFITYNTYTSELGFSDRLMHEPNLNSFPVVEIENQDLLPNDLLSKVNDL